LIGGSAGLLRGDDPLQLWESCLPSGTLRVDQLSVPEAIDEQRAGTVTLARGPGLIVPAHRGRYDVVVSGVNQDLGHSEREQCCR
jgi:hypothetical protein